MSDFHWFPWLLGMHSSRAFKELVQSTQSLGTKLWLPWDQDQRDRNTSQKTAGITGSLCSLVIFSVWIRLGSELCRRDQPHDCLQRSRRQWQQRGDFLSDRVIAKISQWAEFFDVKIWGFPRNTPLMEVTRIKNSSGKRCSFSQQESANSSLTRG